MKTPKEKLFVVTATTRDGDHEYTSKALTSANSERDAVDKAIKAAKQDKGGWDTEGNPFGFEDKTTMTEINYAREVTQEQYDTLLKFAAFEL